MAPLYWLDCSANEASALSHDSGGLIKKAGLIEKLETPFFELAERGDDDGAP